MNSIYGKMVPKLWLMSKKLNILRFTYAIIVRRQPQISERYSVGTVCMFIAFHLNREGSRKEITSNVGEN